MKSKLLLKILLIAMTITMVSCSPKSVYTQIACDWPYYDTVEKLAEASSAIISGKITDISYAVIDYKTGKKVDSCNGDTDNKMLCTVYSVEVLDSMKGSLSKQSEFVVFGGRKGYDEDEQLELLKKSGLSKAYDKIPVTTDNYLPLEIGGEYIFCLTQSGDFYSIVNAEQFAVEINSADGIKLQNLFK